MLSKQVQADIPGQMYMYPADTSVALPEEWVAHAPLATKPFTVSATVISADRDTWIRDWTAKVIG
jgi:thiamine transport system substrate-binding protein